MSMPPNGQHAWMRAPEGRDEDDEIEVPAVAMTGPYLLTHKRLLIDYDIERAETEILSRQAFATLGEARAAFVRLVLAPFPESRDPLDTFAAQKIGEAGGSIALLDGSTLSVEPREWNDLARDVGMFGRPAGGPHQSILDAWNAKHATQGKEASER